MVNPSSRLSVAKLTSPTATTKPQLSLKRSDQEHDFVQISLQSPPKFCFNLSMPFNRRTENLIANLRSLPESQSRAIHRGSKPLDSILETLINKYSIGQDTTEELIMKSWPRIVGERNANRCVPLRINAQNKLLIGVVDSILRRELQFHEPRIMTVLRSLEGCQHINGIILRAG